MKINIVKFERQIILPEFGLSGQQKLNTAKVLVIGAGGLGCPVILYLSAAGINNIGIAENDTINLNNLHRQILYKESQIGILKTDAIKSNLEDFNFIIHPAVDEKNIIEILSKYDIVIDTSDNFNTRYIVNDACVILDKILVSASIHQFKGQLGVYNYPLKNNTRSGTYRCIFPKVPSGSLNCAEAGVLSTVAGVMGTLQAHEAIKVITGIGNILFNQLLIWDGKSMQQHIINYEKNDTEVENILKKGLVESMHSTVNCILENEITPNELRLKLVNQEAIQIIDIREDFEREIFNIGGDWIPMNDLLKQPELISKDIPVILYCKVGERSKIVQQRLIEKYGFTNLYNLKGGINAWLATTSSSD